MNPKAPNPKDPVTPDAPDSAGRTTLYGLMMASLIVAGYTGRKALLGSTGASWGVPLAAMGMLCLFILALVLTRRRPPTG